MKENFSHFSPYPEEEGKKNVEIRINNSSEADNTSGKTQEIAKEFLDANMYKNESFNVHELEKNNEELEAIEMIQLGFNDFLEEYDLPKIDFNIENIHILSPEEYNEKFSDNDGSFAFGHVYCKRGDKQYLLKTLVHELVHKTSFYRVDIEITDDNLYLDSKKSGLGINNNKKIFAGLNEAITERIASDILERIAEQNDYSEEEKENLLDRVSYFPQIVLLMELISKISKEDEVDGDELFKSIVQGAYYGNHAFLKHFEKNQKGLTKILAEMGTEKADAVSVAKKIGFEKNFIEWLEKFEETSEN